MALRRAIGADAPRLARLVDAAYGHYVERLGGPPGPMTEDYHEVVGRHEVIVDERGGDIAGLIVLSIEDGAFFVRNVAVEPAWQGRGVGRALLEHAEHVALQAGFTAITLYTHERMTENRALYRRIGYVELDRGEAGRVPLVYLRKDLTTPPGNSPGA